MSDLDQLQNVSTPSLKVLSAEELKKRLGGQPYQRGDTVMLHQVDYA